MLSRVVLVTRFDECCKDAFAIECQMLRIALEGSGVNDRIIDTGQIHLPHHRCLVGLTDWRPKRHGR